MTAAIYILNGPNSNMLGQREPRIYGTTTLAEVETICRKAAGEVPVMFCQSNQEGVLIDAVQAAFNEEARGIIINPAGFSFTSVGILDALKIFQGPVIEYHISNIHARDAAHRHSIISQGVTAVMAGLGAQGYAHAVRAILEPPT